MPDTKDILVQRWESERR